LSGTLRLFTAVELSPALRHALVAAATRFLALPPGARWTRAVRRVPEENLHVTVRFLGDVGEERVDDLVAALRDAAESVPPGRARLEGFGAFPTPRRPRVVWCGVEDGDGSTDRDGALTWLAAATTAALLRLGFPPETRAFHPHVTVARVRDGRAGREIAARFEHAGLDTNRSTGTFPVGRLTLFRSGAGERNRAGERDREHRRAAGPRYEALASLDLAGTA